MATDTRHVPPDIAEKLRNARFRLKIAYDNGWPARVIETQNEIDELLDQVNGAP